MKVLNFIIAVFYAFYKRLTRKAYLVSSTFIGKGGVRMYSRTVFFTYGDILPINAMEDSISKNLDVKRLIIINISRLPYRSAMNSENKEVRIDVERKKNNNLSK